MNTPLPEEMGGNQLLMMLQEEDRRRLAPHMLVFDLPRDYILQKAGEDVVNTWFPCGAALASFQLFVDDDNTAVEVALVGKEGALGGIVSNGRVPASATAQVRAEGRFLRIKTAALEQVKLESLALRHWFARYSDCLIAQIFQTSACNATHTIVQRTAKWLLVAMARTNQVELELTQERLAEILGVGRTFVTRVVGELRREGIIATRRGVFIIKDPAALRERACDCTKVIEDHYDAVMHGVYHLD